MIAYSCLPTTESVVIEFQSMRNVLRIFITAQAPEGHKILCKQALLWPQFSADVLNLPSN
jgi:hypothetical protein